MALARKDWRIASEKSGKSHERKAANHAREKRRITIFLRCDFSLSSDVICRFFLSCDLPLLSDGIHQKRPANRIREKRQIT
jgi:hypothetical protein